MAPSATDWLQAVGGIAAAWVGVGALLVDRRTRHNEVKHAERAIQAWVRYVDDDPNRSVANGWFLYVSNSAGAPVESWYIELSTSDVIGAADLGPLPPETIRRRIAPTLGPGGATPTVVRLVFRQRDGTVVARTGHGTFEELSAWPASPEDDPMSTGASQ